MYLPSLYLNPIRFHLRVLAFLFFSACSLASLALCACPQDGLSRTDIAGTTMGPIVYRVVIINDENTPDESVLTTEIQNALDHVNDLMSTYKPDSDVSRFNNSDSSEWVSVHQDTARVMSKAIEISKLTDGAFDVTVARAVNLWNFGNERNPFELPSDETVEAVRSATGYQNVSVRMEPPGIKKTIAKLQIDFSAIAKGYAVDRVANVLNELGCKRFLVEVGGEVVGQGLTESNTPWRVGVEKAKMESREIEAVALLENGAMATSGDYRNIRIVGGKRYSHSIDPKTCRPTEELLATACVTANDCMTADALATALMIMGANKATSFCNENGIEYFLVERSLDAPNDSTKFTKHISKGFPLANDPATPVVAERGILPVFIAALIVFSLAVLGMSAGAIFANKPVQGSCGGLANMSSDSDAECGICSEPAKDCVESAS